MSDKELIIKIPEEMYAQIMDENGIDTMLIPYKDIIKNGTLLPKGHGRLFDESDIVNGNYEVIGNRIYELEPIIGADRSDT